MADEIKIDFSDFQKLSADLGKVPRAARPLMRKAIEVNSRNVRDTWRDKLSGSPSLPALPAAVTYDVTSDESPRAPIVGQIGFDKNRAQGPLGNISEFGSPAKNTPPSGYGSASLAENVDDLEKGLSKAVDDAHKQVGL
ncbi:hypothetical protein [Subtercola sp. YIM 133946]|uniref:hypothetical protein n=1 Tax=Subtercola sp. YIM 133946 TaxID=3118909 RepID=UPI002F924E97